MITEEEKKEIVKAFEDRCRRLELTYNKAAKQLGVSPALVSQIRNNNWDNISEERWREVAIWSESIVSSWKLRQTANLDTIQNICEDAQQNSRFLAISAATGLGKTTALKYYASNNPNAFYTLGTNTMQRTDFLDAIQRSMSLDVSGTIYARTSAIIKKLNATPNALVIIDDTSKVPDSALRLLQVIYDETEFRTGIVIAGTEHLKRYIFKMAARDKMGFREIKRRIGYWQDLSPITEQWIKVVCNDFGIVEYSSIKLVQKMALDYGSLRELLTNYQRAHAKGLFEEMTEVEAIASLNFGSN